MWRTRGSSSHFEATAALPSGRASLGLGFRGPGELFSGEQLQALPQKTCSWGKCKECDLKEQIKLLQFLLQAGPDPSGLGSASFCSEWYGFSRWVSLYFAMNIHGALCMGMGPGWWLSTASPHLSPIVKSCEGGEYRGSLNNTKLN